MTGEVRSTSPESKSAVSPEDRYDIFYIIKNYDVKKQKKHETCMDQLQ